MLKGWVRRLWLQAVRGLGELVMAWKIWFRQKTGNEAGLKKNIYLGFYIKQEQAGQITTRMNKYK